MVFISSESLKIKATKLTSFGCEVDRVSDGCEDRVTEGCESFRVAEGCEADQITEDSTSSRITHNSAMCIPFLMASPVVTFDISLNRVSGIYHPGDTIFGAVHIKSTDDIRAYGKLWSKFIFNIIILTFHQKIRYFEYCPVSF